MPDHDEKFVYVEHMIAQHRRLDQLLRRAVSLALPFDAKTEEWLPRLTAGLAAIRCELAQHFGEEDGGGCLEEAMARCPAIAPEVRRLVGEHEELLERLDDLVARCQTASCPTECQVQAIEQELRLVVGELRRHEALECRVVERGFAVSLEDADEAAGDELAAGRAAWNA
jgi:iron-sulfur cluster repair protein YtfE (RIC family)